MRAIDVLRAVLEDHRSEGEQDDPYAAARARARAEKPDRMRFTPTPARRTKAATRKAQRVAQQQYVRELQEAHQFDPSYLEHRFGRGA